MRKRKRESQAVKARQTDYARLQGFTLVEMLISVALVLLMMVMFANVFQMAGDSIGRMRGLAENDQRSRTLQTILKADLDKRTFRSVFPFAANENTGAAGSNIANRQGYFYISENNPYDALDDVIQFTVASTITIRNTDLNPYYGQALNLASFTYPNQPDADDGQLTPNNTGLSTVAEIVYFVRNGNLYRRQLLIREPLAIAGTNPQPTDGTVQTPTANNVFGPILAPGPPQVPVFQYPSSGPFWNDFDYSAYLTYSSALSSYTGAQFSGSNSLDNSGSVYLAIANPSNRFGFSPAQIPACTIAGRPKEFRADTGTADLADFIGRFTLQECSDPTFIYPQNLSSSGHVPVDPSLSLTLDPTDKFVTGFGNGPRRGEDLLLSNVHAFDVQVWDELAQGFVNIGDPSLVAGSSDFALGSRYGSGQGTPPSPSYGPRVTENIVANATNAVFDTWHPLIDFSTGNDPSPSPSTTTGQTIYDDPPYRPLLLKAQSVTQNTADVLGWQYGHTYSVGDVVFPTGPPGTYLQSPPYSVTGPTKLPYGQPFFYRCVQAGLSAASTPLPSPADEPAWPQVAGLTVIDGSPTTGVIWQAVDNRKPLKAIKLQIRFVDTSSQQMRQITIIQSLVD